MGEIYCYFTRHFYPISRFPERVFDYYRRLRGLRWTPATRRWEEAVVDWDMEDFLVRVDEGGVIGKSWARTSFEYRPVRLEGELIYADHKSNYLYPGGKGPPSYDVHCMVSHDNGRSWKRRAVIAFDPEGVMMPSETGMCVNTSGQLVCVHRNSDHRRLPMWITFSGDAGRTWMKPKQLFDQGVMPQLLLLGNGILVLAYGRPGVLLSFSPEGTGESWTEPVQLFPEEIHEKQGCGYTSLLSLDEDRFLIAFADFLHVDSRDRTRKAIKVQEIEVTLP